MKAAVAPRAAHGQQVHLGEVACALAAQQRRQADRVAGGFSVGGERVARRAAVPLARLQQRGAQALQTALPRRARRVGDQQIVILLLWSGGAPAADAPVRLRQSA